MLWTEGSAGKIMRADLDGRNRVELITGLDYPTAIALDDAAGKLYWAHESDDGIKRADLGGSNIETVISSNYEFGYGIAVDSKNGKLFWTEGNDDKIQSANLDGSRVRTLFSGLEFPIAIDVDPNSNRIFWSETDDPEGIYTATSNGSGRRFLIGPYADDLVVDAEDGRIYWTMPTIASYAPNWMAPVSKRLRAPAAGAIVRWRWRSILL